MKNINLSFSKINLGKLNQLKFGKSPESDWKIILIGFIALSILAVGFCGYFYLKITTEDISGTDSTSTQNETFNLSRLRQTLKHYQDKNTEYQNIKVTPETILDPSI